jgi:carbonic anhydrase
MEGIIHLFEKNRNWAKRISEINPDFFLALSRQHKPQYLWIGCSDSRVPANQVVDLPPGEVFVHRNVANVVVYTDLNCLSVMQYAIDVLQVKHVIVCGHYGCGGIESALEDKQHGLIDNWLMHVRDVRKKHTKHIDTITDHGKCVDHLCELNVIEQVVNVCQTTVVRNAWSRGVSLRIHGLVYSLTDGLLRDLSMHISNYEELTSCYEAAIARYSTALSFEDEHRRDIV